MRIERDRIGREQEKNDRYEGTPNKEYYERKLKTLGGSKDKGTDKPRGQ